MRIAFDDDEQRRLTLAHAMPLLWPGGAAAGREVYHPVSMDNGQWRMNRVAYRHSHAGEPGMGNQHT